MQSGLIQDALEAARGVGLKAFLGLLLAVWLVYWVCVGIYRVYFHPLAKFPGPKLAALTFWYEFYYEIYPNKFQYLWKIKELHEQYGPIVRINPIHIHINDADYFDTVYASGSTHKRDRCGWFQHVGSKTVQGAMLETLDHDHHRLRRSALAGFFSKTSIRNVQPIVVREAKKIVARFRKDSQKIVNGEKGLVNLNEAFAAFTMDVISGYCFGSSMQSLDRPDYGREWLTLLHEGVQVRPLGRQVPWFVNTMMDLPPWITSKISPAMARMNEFNYGLHEKIKRVYNHEDEVSRGLEGATRTIFHDVRDDVHGKLPLEEKDPLRLMGDASILLGAGTETTARTMGVILFYLLKKPEIGERLMREVREVFPTKDAEPSQTQLEALPYLSAVINEGLRVAHGVSSRQPRIATQEDLQYKQWTIPRGTPVMESLYLIHMDPSIYPLPFEFQPERWLSNPNLKRYLMPFSRGSRQCLGMNLALAELYYGIALLWRSLRMELWDTVEKRDVLTTYDCFIGMADLKSEGIKVRILGDVED